MRALVSIRDLRKAYRNASVIFSKKYTPYTHIMVMVTESVVYVAAIETVSAAICRVALKDKSAVTGHAMVHAEDFKRLIDPVTANEVEVVASGNSFTIRSAGEPETLVECNPALDYVEYITSVENKRFCDTLSTDALEVLNAVSKAALSESGTSNILKHVHIMKRGDYVTVEAADGFRFHQCSTPGNSVAFDTVVDLQDCKALVKLFKHTSAGIFSCPHPVKGDKTMTVFGNDSVLYMVDRVHDTTYPDTGRLSLKIDDSFKYTVDSAVMLEEVKALKRGIWATRAVNLYGRSVNVDGTADALNLRSVLAGVPAATVKAEYTGEQSAFPVAFAYNVDYLIDALECFSGNVELQFSDFGTLQLRAVNERTHTRAIIMPVKLR